MRKVYFYCLILLVAAIVFLFVVYGRQRTNSDDLSRNIPEPVKIISTEAENFVESSENCDVVTDASGNGYVRAESSGWLKVDVNIDIPGRYQSQIHLAAGTGEGTTCWIEDYCENKSNRIYNITGNMIVGSLTHKKGMITRDGTPLNKGLHKMKIHYDGPVNIDRIVFKLMKSHQATTHIMKQNTKGDRWQVVWEDEFDGSVIDTTKWTFELGDWGWGRNEIQYYTENDPNNAYIDDGKLIIKAIKNNSGKGWTSARLTTKSKVSFIYGKIEFRAKVPAARGNWAAGWMLGDEYVDESSSPWCGEIAILSSVGYEVNDETGLGVAHASAHSGSYYFTQGNQSSGTSSVENMNTEFHSYSVEWTPSGIKAYVDDRHYVTYNNTSTDLSWPFDKPQNLVLNLAMGGRWAGYYGIDQSVNSLKLIVDYVRVYELR